MKGLTVDIYRNAGYTCEINALNKVNGATIIDKDAPELFTASAEKPAIRIVRRNLFGREYIHAEPIERGLYAFGGSFIHTSDSRFSELFSPYPIPLHDRNMNLEKQY